MDKPVWEKPNPVKKHSKLSPKQKAKARARARAAGRSYPNMVDNIWAARTEQFDPREYDYEGDMAKTQLKTIMRHAQHMHDMLEDNTNLPEWVQSKITLATDYMQTAHDYMMSEVKEEFELKRLGSNPGKFKRLVAKHLGAKAAEKINGADGSRIMAIAKRKGNTALFRKGSFIKNFYGEALEIGTDAIRIAYQRMTPGQDKNPFVLGHDANVPQDNKVELRRRRAKKLFKAYFDEANENKPLGKPFRTPGEKKKFAVYVRNGSGNVVKVRFGDPNLSIKRHRPGRRKSFRARHNCQTPGPRWKARYWSCRQWRAGARVEA